ncbi:hypothetical protein VB671_13060, partial [Nodularia spumigena UHCC 0040]|nr:hypothetical protein [Nodularia spumigena UHCC 0040]
KAVPQSDFFALGRTFVYLLTGKSPDSFSEDPSNGELIWRDHAAGISDKLVEFIDYLMAPFPGNRPQDTQEILHKLAKFDTPSPAFGQNTGNNQSANERIESLWKRHERAKQYESLINKAERFMAGIPPQESSPLSRAVMDLKEALTTDNSTNIDAAGNRLIDMMFAWENQ